VLADRYNRELGGGAGGAHILPARLGRLVEQAQSGLDPLDYRHPIVQAFRGREKSGLLTVPVGKHYQLEIPKNSTARVVLAVGADPLVVEQAVRRGHVVLAATSADSSWTALCVWPCYVPLVQEMLAWCVGRESRRRNVEVGDPLGGSVSAAAAGVPLWLRRPDGQSRQLPLGAEGDYAAWSYADTTQSGIYTATLGPPVSRSQSFAVNVDIRQSDLAQLSQEDLRSDVWPGIPFLYQTTWQNLDARGASPIARPGQLHVSLLYAVLGLLFTETFLAWRFGHHAS
jgi:hypothetical protein